MIFAIGLQMSGQVSAATQAHIDSLLAQVRPAEAVQQDLLQNRTDTTRTTIRYEADLAIDLKDYKVENVSYADLLEPLSYEILVDSPQTLAPGETLTTSKMTVQATIQTVAWTRERATIKAKHSIAVLTNTSDMPLAYNLSVKAPTRGDCASRGARQHNAMALGPGEVAEITVCSGETSLEVSKLEVIPLNALSFIYISKLPPSAIGAPLLENRAHTPPQGVTVCSDVPSERLTERMRLGELAWADIIDFYARHNCERAQIMPGYRRQTSRLLELPVSSAPPGTAADAGAAHAAKPDPAKAGDVVAPSGDVAP